MEGGEEEEETRSLNNMIMSAKWSYSERRMLFTEWLFFVLLARGGVVGS